MLFNIQVIPFSVITKMFSSNDNYFLVDLKNSVDFPGSLKINVKARLCINVFIADYFIFS